ncbi:hypothetical protein KAX17_14860 [Candidatus Bipolaricaulota bacterium]|nr:hypothetical protein [Candidatus Bipolaricaulota bacterium]
MTMKDSKPEIEAEGQKKIQMPDESYGSSNKALYGVLLKHTRTKLIGGA